IRRLQRADDVVAYDDFAAWEVMVRPQDLYGVPRGADEGQHRRSERCLAQQSRPCSALHTLPEEALETQVGAEEVRSGRASRHAERAILIEPDSQHPLRSVAHQI